MINTIANVFSNHEHGFVTNALQAITVANTRDRQ